MSSLFSIGEDELDLDDEVRLMCSIFLIILANKFLRNMRILFKLFLEKIKTKTKLSFPQRCITKSK